MRDVHTIEVTDEISKATNSLAESQDEDINLIKVRPPEEQNDGMEASDELLKSLHFLDTSSGLIGPTKNKSPVCGMEIWYENNKIKFMFQTPTEEMETEYRQQISGYYKGAEIESQTETEGMFIRTDSSKNEAIAVTEFNLNKHYFMPISSPASESEEMDVDPYKRLSNEIDTKDNSRVIIQFLYKPVSYDWTDMWHRNLQSYAGKVQDKGGYKTKYFGLKIESVDESSIWEGAAADMRSRISKPAYYVNVRLAIVCRAETQEQAHRKAKSRAQNVANAISVTYRTKSGQKLIPKSYGLNKQKKLKQTLVNMIERNPTNMSQETGPLEMIYSRISSDTSTIILTADELSGLVHIPSQGDIQSSSVDWANQLVEGDVPGDIKEFEPATKEEQEEIGDKDIAVGENNDDFKDGNKEDEDDAESIL